jgi:hypothetical protein
MVSDRQRERQGGGCPPGPSLAWPPVRNSEPLEVHPPTAISRGAKTESSRRFPIQTSITANQTSIKTQGLGDSGTFGFRLIVFIVVIHPFGQNESSTHRRGHGGLGSPDRTPDDLVEFQIIRRIFAAQVHLV